MNNEGQTGKVQKKEEKNSTLNGVVATCSGNHIQPVYKRVYDKETDTVMVKKVDEFNLFEFIQSSKSQTDLAILQKRFVELGEIPAIDPTMGDNDLAVFPSNIHEVYAMVNDINGNYAKLPKSIQDIFGSAEAYTKAILDGSYQATLLAAINKKEEPKQEASQEGEK